MLSTGPPLLHAKTGFPAAIASSGTIPKCSSSGVYMTHKQRESSSSFFSELMDGMKTTSLDIPSSDDSQCAETSETTRQTVLFVFMRGRRFEVSHELNRIMQTGQGPWKRVSLFLLPPAPTFSAPASIRRSHSSVHRSHRRERAVFQTLEPTPLFLDMWRTPSGLSSDFSFVQID